MSYYGYRRAYSYPEVERSDVPVDVLRSRVEELRPRITRDWDRGFVESLTEQLDKGKKLSVKQVATLEKIEQRNDPTVMAKREAWRESYTDERRNVAKVCAAYYKSAGYFGDLADKVLEDDTFVPSEKQFKAMCENKYAMKVRASTFDEPVYPTGAMVAFRTCAPYEARNSSPAGSAVVIRVNPVPVTSPAKGAKTYEVLPVGAVKTFLVEERHLKKMRKSKKK